MRYGRGRGFTLVELLVVIAVIAILASILFPVLVNAKQAAQRARCQSNLSQIGKAFESYTSDYNGCYPNLGQSECTLWMGRYWRDLKREPVHKYVVALAVRRESDTRGSDSACPADPTPPGIYSGTSYAYSDVFLS